MVGDALIGIFIGSSNSDCPYLWLQKSVDDDQFTFGLNKFGWTGSFKNKDDDLMIGPECMVTWK